MRHPALMAFTSILLALALVPPGATQGQRDDRELTKQLILSYDLLEAGKLDQAQQVYDQILQKHPGHPLALNNLGAIMAKRKRYDDAIRCLTQALAGAKGYQVAINRVCDLDGICLAFRPLQEVYGTQELEPLIKLNLELIKGFKKTGGNPS